MENLLIRPAKSEDAAAMLDIYKHHILHTSVTFETEVPDLKVFRQRLENIMVLYPWLVLEYDNKVAAYAYAGPYRSRSAYQWHTEVSVYVHEQFAKMGFASTLYAVLFEILKAQGFYKAYAVITLPNDASVKFHEKFGFEYMFKYDKVGYKLDSWHDVGWWELILKPFLDAPKALIPFREILKSDNWTKAVETGLERLK